ncbi:MAG: PAS domain-containing protein [Candidatus Korobacteraceae bacterium]
MIPVIPPAQVEVDSNRRYISVNDSACELLGYSRQELLNMRIDDLSFPTGAHVAPMYEQFVRDGGMQGIFALKRKNGEVIRIRFVSETANARSTATWTHYEVWKDAERSRLRE